jgi:hypothetical protein
MIRNLFSRGPRPHRGIHRRRGPGSYDTLPRTGALLDVRMLIPQADPWAGRCFL